MYLFKHRQTTSRVAAMENKATPTVIRIHFRFSAKEFIYLFIHTFDIAPSLHHRRYGGALQLFAVIS